MPDKAWVTYVKDDSSCVKALILAQSLQRVMTKARLVVLAHPSISKPMRSKLTGKFDDLLKLDHNLVQNGTISIELYAKVFCFGIPFMKKCVFIDPDCLVMNPCDNLFDHDGISATRKPNGNLDLSLFTFSPCLDLCEELMELLVTTGGKNGHSKENGVKEQCLAKWMESTQNFHQLDDKFLRVVDVESGIMNCTFVELLTIRVPGKYPIDCNSEPIGIVEKCIYRFWNKLIAENSLGTEKISDLHNNYGRMDRGKEPIAIIGMACRLPGANNVDEFWNLLKNGEDAIRPVPENRWTPDQCGKVDTECRKVQAGFLKCPVDTFDGKFFGISPMELAYMDPQQRLLLEILWEALEDGGIDPHSLRESRTGIFTGTWRDDYRTLLTEFGSRGKDFYRGYMGNSLGAGAGKLAFLLGACGSNIATESGCSSSMVAVGLACKNLRQGDSNIALACGVNLLLHPFSPKDMNMVVAPDGRCKTFDTDADGFGRAEGCGVLVLKRFSDAVNDGDKIWALIRGYGEAQEGMSRSMGTPTVECESLSMKIALEDAGVNPKEVSYVEAHGTGTPVGDPMEIEAISRVYQRQGTDPLFVGSVKTNVGHTESCSGITGIIKVVLSLKNEIIPPNLHLKNLNPNVKLDKIPAKIPLKCEPWLRSTKSRLAGVSSFGITGTDAHIIIEEAPIHIPELRKPNFEPERPAHILALSAKSDKALNDIIEKYVQFLEKSEDSIENICYTANTGRAHFTHRVTAFGQNLLEIRNKLNSKTLVKHQAMECAPKICFLFTGQGSQYPGMAQQLYETCPVFRMSFDTCANLLEEYDIHIRRILWGSDSDSGIKRTIFSQPSIFCIEYGLLKMWEAWGIVPDCVIGHSLGEFAAAVACGILTLDDALKLVAERSRLIESLPGGKMLVIKANHSSVREMLENTMKNNNLWLDIAAINSEEQTVIAGSEEAITNFSIICQNNNFSTHVLDATHAFHSKDMEPILEEYFSIASAVGTNRSLKCQYISGLEGKLIKNDLEVNAKYWMRHTRESVKYLDACKVAYEEGYRLFLEIGPQPVLSSLMMMNIVDYNSEAVTFLPSIRRKENNWTTVLNSLGQLYAHGANPDWKAFDDFYLRAKVPLPFYPFERKIHWFSLNSGSIQRELHSLLGSIIPNVTGTKLYQGQIDLEKKPFLRDHVIGKHVIFPGAGYIEMTLAAGHASTLGNFEDFYPPLTPIMVENMMINSPMELFEGQLCQVQTAVKSCTETNSESNSEIGTKISIYSHLSIDLSTTKWICHSRAKFSPVINYSLQDEPLQDLMNRLHIERDHEEISTRVYEKWAKTGLDFGLGFRSIHKIWEGEDEVLAQVFLPDSETDTDFHCHPILIDAMMQTTMMTEKFAEDKLRVPISIGKFIWFGKAEGKTFYIHGKFIGDNREKATILRDEGDKILALMMGLETIETSVSAILRVLEKQRLCLPKLYEDIWRPQIGTLKSRVKLEMFVGNAEFQESFAEALNVEEMTEEENSIVTMGDRLSSLLIINILRQLGIDPKLTQKLNLQQIVADYKVSPIYTNFLRRFFQILTAQGYLELDFEGIECLENFTDSSWTTIQQFPSPEETAEEKAMIIGKIGHEIEMKLQVLVAERLPDVLLGKGNILDVLFLQERKTGVDISAEELYSNSRWISKTNKQLSDVMRYLIETQRIPCSSSTSQRTTPLLRILEIGAGTGSATKSILPILEELSVKYEYTFTDISQAFFLKGEKTFEAYPTMQYKILNIEDDLMTQGFSPNYFDVVIASNVIHATRDLPSSLQNIKLLLRSSGLFLMLEIFAPSTWLDIIFGGLDGFWKFTDFDLRPHHPYISSEKWTNVLKRSGFDSACAVHLFDRNMGVVVAQNSDIQLTANQLTYSVDKAVNKDATKTWLIFEKNPERWRFLTKYFNTIGRETVQVLPCPKSNEMSTNSGWNVRPDVKSDLEHLIKHYSGNIEGIVYLWGYDNETEVSESVQGFLHLTQTILSGILGTLPKLYVITKGTVYIGDQEPSLPIPGALWGISKTLRSEQSNFHCRNIDLDPNEEDTLGLKFQELFHELWVPDQEYQIAYRQRGRYVVRLNSLKLQKNPLSLPNSNRFALILPETNAISDLKFGPMGKVSLKGNEIEIQVKAAALNFKDVLNVIKPDAQFLNSNSVGADFAGVISAVGSEVTKRKVGDAVLGCNFEAGALPSHIRTTEEGVIAIPTELTFCDAATFPAVFATAYYCMVNVSNLQRGETVLIHAASGGVGLIGIQIAKSLGVNVIATAGSKRKRAFLRLIGIQHVFNSRDTKYEQQILEVTGDRGVDVVINSLTGPGFKEATLNVCSQNARFVEMSKLNVWTEEEVKNFRQDVEYVIIDLTSVSTGTWVDLLQKLEQYLDQGQFRPIPYTRFDAVEIREALSYLQKAKHIGKVVISMPEIETMNGQIEVKSRLFNDRSTYLITGGLGGIGLEVAKWMIDLGANHIVLCGRNQPTEKASEAIEVLRSSGMNVNVIQADVGSKEQCEQLFESIEANPDLPPLRGIMHAAGCLSDGTIANQTWEKFQTTFNAKVDGSWNLHQLSLKMRMPLEHFVLYSSVVVTFGGLGQSNHSAANAFMDTLAHYRNAMGLSALTINWGQWGQVGVAAQLEVPGITPFTPLQALKVLELMLKSHKTQCGVIDGDPSIWKATFSWIKSYTSELKDIKDDGHELTSKLIKSEEFWSEYDSASTDELKRSVITGSLIKILRLILKLEADEKIDENQHFQEMGVDSLMMVELKNLLQTILGDRVNLTVSALSECHSINLLSNRLFELINGTYQKGEMSMEEKMKLIREDSELSPDIQTQGRVGPPFHPSEITSVLITGTTGQLAAQILQQISQMDNIMQIYCLFRPRHNVTAYERFEKHLAEIQLDPFHLDKVMKKATVLQGSISEKYLGIPKGIYDKLASEIDSVIHCAVKNNHLEPYLKSETNTSTDIRSVNVLGTKNVLEFATTSKVKWIYHASAFVALTKICEKTKTFPETFPEPDEFDTMPNFGYATSKFICDRLMSQALERGVPIKVFRFPFLAGDTKYGKFSMEQNHGALRLLNYIKLGVMPSAPLPVQVLPVDVAAKVSVSLFFNNDAPTGLYNVSNPHPRVEQDLVQVAEEFGYSLDLVGHSEFIEKIKAEGEDSVLHGLKELYLNEDFSLAISSQGSAVVGGWMDNPEGFYYSAKLNKFIPGIKDVIEDPLDTIRRDANYAKTAGLFAKFKLES